MCGIAGVLNLNGEPLKDPSLANRMASYLVHRGPDQDGSLADGPVAFGFRRLSIIDLETGNQPISNEQETIWVMFNGEIYNFVELRNELQKQGHIFRTKSDTEVIVHTYESYGLDFLQHFRGMFAIALWDRSQKRLILARDRIGKKPLFYSMGNAQLVFASEVKALLAWPGLNRSINVRALHDYLTFLYIPTPESIFEEVYKLPPAHMLIADCCKGSFSLHRYWRISPMTDRTKPLSFYIEGLREILTESVRLRLRSDVPLGCFLSGGIDSTIITGLISREASPVLTINIGYKDERFDESRYARLVSSFLHTTHLEETVNAFNVSPKEFLRLVWHMDEPFGDSSFIPTYWASKTARKQVKVVLSGDGGDELFAGYLHFRYLQWILRTNKIPIFTRRQLIFLINILKSSALLSSFQKPLRRLGKAMEIASMNNEEEMILALISYFTEADKLSLYHKEWQSRLNGYTSLKRLDEQLKGVDSSQGPLARFMTREFETNLVDDGLVKVDRASMMCSLEVRSPFLDHKLVEFAAGIPNEYKLHHNVHKFILKKTFRDLLPPEIIYRKKHGFELPFASWFQRKVWRDLLIDALSRDRLKRRGIFNPDYVLPLRDNILNNPEATGLEMSAYQLRHRVWLLFILELWMGMYIDETA